jgi:hypothetical protein
VEEFSSGEWLERGGDPHHSTCACTTNAASTRRFNHDCTAHCYVPLARSLLYTSEIRGPTASAVASVLILCWKRCWHPGCITTTSPLYTCERLHHHRPSLLSAHRFRKVA